MTKDRAQHCYILGSPRSFPYSPALTPKLVQGYQWGQRHHTCTSPGPGAAGLPGVSPGAGLKPCFPSRGPPRPGWLGL